MNFRNALTNLLLALCLLIMSEATLPFAHAQEYAFLLRSRGNPYWQTMASGIEEAGKTLGAKVTVLMMESESAAEDSVNLCNTLIERKPNLLGIAAANVPSGLQCLKRAQERGIRVADLDGSITPEDAKNGGVKLSFTVGSDNFQIGGQAADVAVRQIGDKPIRAFILEGAPGSIQGIKRADGFRTRLKLLAPSAQIVASISADWERLKAVNNTNDILSRSPDLSLIFAANDVMALGAVESLRASGRNNVLVLGVDGTADARRAVMEGRLYATIAQLPFLIGKRAVELAVKQDTGDTISEITPSAVVTQEALEKKTDPLLQYVR